MTRINVIPVDELSDQHLIAEYRELPRALKWKGLDISNTPDRYCLGVGHIKWGRKHWLYLLQRYGLLMGEMRYRGFNINKKYLDSANLVSECSDVIPYEAGWYKVSAEDIKLNRERIIERYNMKPNWYRWTRREKPNYLKGV